MLPLEGLSVLDLSRVLAGPYATMVLGDLGADVLKVEHPERGDDTRHWGPPFAKESASRPTSSRSTATSARWAWTLRPQEIWSG